MLGEHLQDDHTQRGLILLRGRLRLLGGRAFGLGLRRLPPTLARLWRLPRSPRLRNCFRRGRLRRSVLDIVAARVGRLPRLGTTGRLKDPHQTLLEMHINTCRYIQHRPTCPDF
jgi:hypothetical protein